MGKLVRRSSKDRFVSLWSNSPIGSAASTEAHFAVGGRWHAHPPGPGRKSSSAGFFKSAKKIIVGAVTTRKRLLNSRGMNIKNLLRSAVLLVLTNLSALAVVDLGDATSGTPYDRYMTPVKQVFDSMQSEGASMEKVESLMRQGRGFRYAPGEPFFPGGCREQTAARRCGDCKDKALLAHRPDARCQRPVRDRQIQARRQRQPRLGHVAARGSLVDSRLHDELEADGGGTVGAGRLCAALLLQQEPGLSAHEKAAQVADVAVKGKTRECEIRRIRRFVG